MTSAGLDALNALPADELARRLSGPERVATIRAAAEGGVAEAQALYAQLLLDGEPGGGGVPAAVGWFWRAAAQGHAMAANMLGRCYDLGQGVAVDKARAAEWYAHAAGRGLDWAMYNHATLLALGEGVAEDKAAALALFRRAAEGGGPAAAKAWNYVGSFHEDGWVVARDMGAAADCYARAAAGGDFRGMFNHARMLLVAGQAADADDWIARALAAGTPRFRAQVEAWLAGRDQNAIDSHYRAG